MSDLPSFTETVQEDILGVLDSIDILLQRIEERLDDAGVSPAAAREWFGEVKRRTRSLTIDLDALQSLVLADPTIDEEDLHND
jgi:hypothetical protein